MVVIMSFHVCLRVHPPPMLGLVRIKKTACAFGGAVRGRLPLIEAFGLQLGVAAASPSLASAPSCRSPPSEAPPAAWGNRAIEHSE